VPSVVCTMVCLCNRLWPSGLAENDFMVNIARGHGRGVFTQCFPMWPGSLSFYRTIFRPLRCNFPRLRAWASAARTVSVEMDRARNNYWRVGALLHSGAVSRSVSAKRLRTLPKTMKPAGPERCSLTRSLPLLRPSVRPSMSHRLIRLHSRSLTLSGLPIYVARNPAAPFPRAPFSVLANDPARGLSPCRWTPSTGMKPADQ
jgi:hypothetical protein